jgi:hypothetical protein
MSKEEMDASKQEQAQPESGAETNADFGSLLEIAKEVQAQERTAEEQIDFKTAELTSQEAEKKAERSQTEKAVDFSLASGKGHYQEITDPQSYDRARQAWVDEGLRIAKEHGSDSDEFRKHGEQSTFFETNSVRKGMVDNEFPNFSGWVKMETPRTADEYLQNMGRAINDSTESGNKYWRDEYIPNRTAGKLHSPWVGDKGGWYDAKSKPEEIQADVEQARQRIEGATRDGQFSLRKHAEGFGRAALEAGDIAVAIDNLDAGGVLESPDVVGVLRAKLVELKESPKAEDKIKLRKASEKLLAIQTRRQATEGK